MDNVSNQADGWMRLNVNFLRKILQVGKRGIRPTCLSEVEVIVNSLPNPSIEKDSNFPSAIVATGSTVVRIGSATDEWARILDVSLQSMNENEVSSFRVKTRNSSWITFQLHLIKIVSSSLAIHLWNVDLLFQTSKQLKEQGILLYKTNNIVEAFYEFSKSVKLVLPLEVRLLRKLAINEELTDADNHERTQVIQIVVDILNNMAACQLHQKNYNHALYLCNLVLKRSPNNIKAIFRKASALTGTSNCI